MQAMKTRTFRSSCLPLRLGLERKPENHCFYVGILQTHRFEINHYGSSKLSLKENKLGPPGAFLPHLQCPFQTLGAPRVPAAAWREGAGQWSLGAPGSCILMSSSLCDVKPTFQRVTVEEYC